MDYTPPIGGAPNDPYVDANPAIGLEGSLVPAAAIEDPQREIVNVILAASLTPNSSDSTQLLQAINAIFSANQKAVIISNVTFEASVSNGEVVRWDSGNSRFDEAVADGTSNNRAVGIADVTNSKVYLYGECPLFSGLTPDARYYLSSGTAGAITTTAPADAVMVGIAKNATTVFVDIDAGAAVPDASTTVKGKVQLATSAEAQALGDALKALTPATLAAALQGANQSLTTNGYQKLPGGLIFQWGTATSPTTVTFPIAFPTACYAVVETPTPSGVLMSVSTVGTTSFVTNGSSSVFWIAIGK